MLGSREGNGEEKKGLMRAEREVKLHGGADSAKSTLHWRLARSGDMEGLGWRAERRGTSRNPSSSIRNCPTTAAGSIYSPSTAILPRSFQFRAVSLPTTLSNLSQFHLRDCILSRGSLRDDLILCIVARCWTTRTKPKESRVLEDERWKRRG